jgi:glycosyltransferase involved in cell wall biosynthesis
MNFSKEMNEIGRVDLSKIVHLFSVIVRICFVRITSGASILYYPPAGPDKIPIIRDIIILNATRWLFKKTIFHFHAGGVSGVKFNSRLLQFFFQKAYFNADCAILLSDLNPPDGEKLHSLKSLVIPYGIEDNFRGTRQVKNEKLKILFVGLLKESKGILILLMASSKLKKEGLKFTVEVVGKFESREFEDKVWSYVIEHQLESCIIFKGVLEGASKFKAYNDSDVFCFPTFFESETFGVVLLEAMQFSLPIVATEWRGIPSVVNSGHNGFLVKPLDVEDLACKLRELILDEKLRKKMGDAGRRIFLSKFTLDVFYNNMEKMFLEC